MLQVLRADRKAKSHCEEYTKASLRGVEPKRHCEEWNQSVIARSGTTKQSGLLRYARNDVKKLAMT